MEYCVNHPEKEAYEFCHYCGKPFCKECLTEEGEYNVCNNRECREKAEAEKTHKPAGPVLLPEEVECPSCKCKISLDDKERALKKVHCPECEAYIDYSVNPPSFEEPKKYIPATWSFNQGDLFIIKSLFDDAEIDYYTTGENFLSVDPLIQPARFWVLESQLELAEEILKGSNLNVTGVSFREDVSD